MPTQSPTNAPLDLTTLVSTLQTLNQILTRNGVTLAGGVAVVTTPPTYLVASLPATASTGATAYVPNGRKPGQGAGAGTGVPVFFDGSGWYSACSGTLVAA